MKLDQEWPCRCAVSSLELWEGYGDIVERGAVLEVLGRNVTYKVFVLEGNTVIVA